MTTACLTRSTGSRSVTGAGIAGRDLLSGRRSNRKRPGARQWRRRLPLLVTIPTPRAGIVTDRKSTRLNSSHLVISYAVFCLKKKKYNQGQTTATGVSVASYLDGDTA